MLNPEREARVIVVGFGEDFRIVTWIGDQWRFAALVCGTECGEHP